MEHPGGSVWEIRGTRHGVTATQTWGTPRRPAFELVAALCEQRPVRVTDTVTGPDGVKREVLNVSDTLAAQDKARELGERFADWVWEDTDRAETLARVYNERFNAIVLRSYDSAGPDTMALPGLAQGFTPRPHQYAAVARMIAEPGVLLAHEVGAGKTAAVSMGVMELRRLGLVRKPAIVVPNNMLEQWAREFSALYPRARLLIATKADLTAARRREFVARAATGDWDAVVMTHSAFERLPMSLETQRAYLDREAEEMQRWLDALVADRGAAEPVGQAGPADAAGRPGAGQGQARLRHRPRGHLRADRHRPDSASTRPTCSRTCGPRRTSPARRSTAPSAPRTWT